MQQNYMMDLCSKMAGKHVPKFSVTNPVRFKFEMQRAYEIFSKDLENIGSTFKVKPTLFITGRVLRTFFLF